VALVDADPPPSIRVLDAEESETVQRASYMPLAAPSIESMPQGLQKAPVEHGDDPPPLLVAHQEEETEPLSPPDPEKLSEPASPDEPLREAPASPAGKDEWLQLPIVPLSRVELKLVPTVAGETPEAFTRQKLAEAELAPPPQVGDELRAPELIYAYVPGTFCHHPLYFEQRLAERCGQHGHCLAEHATATAHFFGTVPGLPYLMGRECPHSCVPATGYSKCGDCLPPPPERPWGSVRGGVFQGLAEVGLILLIP
jgi:hypothetical protein